jgi:uncharacterized protein (TIGR03000 family)
MLASAAMLLILVSQTGAQTKLNGLGKPYNLQWGPYEGGHGWSYAESYGYGFPFSPLAIPWTAVYPYSAPYFSPSMQGPWNKPGLYYRYGSGRYGPFATPPGQYNPAPAVLAVTVPPEAEVWVDGNPTRQAGEQRLFASPPLNPGQNYLYVLRVRWMENGQPVEHMKTVNVQGGEKVELQFPPPQPR